MTRGRTKDGNGDLPDKSSIKWRIPLLSVGIIFCSILGISIVNYGVTKWRNNFHLQLDQAQKKFDIQNAELENLLQIKVQLDKKVEVISEQLAQCILKANKFESETEILIHKLIFSNSSIVELRFTIQELEVAKEALIHEKEHCQADISNLTNTVAELRDTIEKNQIHSNLQASQVSSLNQQIEKMLAKTEEDSASRAKEVQDLETQLTSARTEIADIEKANAALEQKDIAYLASIADLETIIARSENDKSNLSEVNAECRSAAIDLQRLLDNSQSEVLSCESSKSTLLESLEQSQLLRNQSNEKWKDCNGNLNALQSQTELWKQEFATLQTAKDQLTEQLSNESIARALIEQQRASLAAQSQTAKSELEECLTYGASLQTKLDQSHGALKQSEVEKASVANEVKSLLAVKSECLSRVIGLENDLSSKESHVKHAVAQQQLLARELEVALRETSQCGPVIPGSVTLSSGTQHTVATSAEAQSSFVSEVAQGQSMPLEQVGKSSGASVASTHDTKKKKKIPAQRPPGDSESDLAAEVAAVIMEGV